MKGLKEGLTLLFIFFVSIVGGIFGSEIVGPYFIKRPIFLKYSLEPTPVFVIEKKEIKVDEGSALKTKKLIEEKEKEIIDEISKSIFVLRKKEIQKPAITLSSGENSLILSFPEISFEEGKTFFEFEGEKIFPKLVKKEKNLLLLKVKKNLKSVDFFKIDSLKVGERIFFLSKSLEEGKEKLILDEGFVTFFNENKIESNLKENKEGFLFSEDGKFLGVLKFEGKNQIIIPISIVEKFLKSK